MQSSEANEEIRAECAFCHYVSTYNDVVRHISLHHEEEEDTENAPSSASEVDSAVNKESCEWTEGETKFLLDKFEVYLSMVGPMKRFRRKKDMWQKISEDLTEICNVTRSPLQCENRYKTILKRKKKATDANRMSGNVREEIPFENELNKISAVDDSIEPDVCTDGKITRKKAVILPGLVRKRKREKTVQEVLMEINEKKEEAKERRHRVKLETMRDMLKEFFKKDKSEEK